MSTKTVLMTSTVTGGTARVREDRVAQYKANGWVLQAAPVAKAAPKAARTTK